MNYTNKTMYDCVAETAKQYPNQIAYSFMGNTATYQSFCKKIDTCSKALLAMGTKKGDILCVAMPNVPQAIIFIYAANQIGASVNMIHPLSSENEMLDFFTRVNAKTVLILDQFYDKVKAVEDKTNLSHVIVASVAEALSPIKSVAYKLTLGRKIKKPVKNEKVLFWNEFMALSADCKEENYAVHDETLTALIMHSGGTTGKVKGVCLSNFAVNSSAQQMADANPMLDKSDRFLSVMPIFHGNGLVIGVHTMLLVGARCVLIPRFTPETYAKDLLKNKCNYMSGVPALFERLMDVEIMKKADLSFLKGIFSGADYLSVELERRINAFMKEHHSPVMVRQGYGMTEGVVATLLNPYDKPKEGSIGLPLPGVKVKIVKDGTEEELPRGEVGEIVFSADTNMTCYYNNEEETNLVMKTHSDGLKWIHSGDLGYEDEDGFFFFKGRIKRMIVVNGYNVFPNELENIIESFPMVSRCCILGIAKSEGATAVKAFIVLKEGYTPSDELKQEIIAEQRKHIARYAVAKEIEFIEEMPKTKVGKVDYNALLKK